MRKTHVCNNDTDIEVIKTHVVYIKASIDEIKAKMDKQESKYATKRELNIHKGLLAGTWGAFLAAFWYLLGVK
jgi:hypothetical protein